MSVTASVLVFATFGQLSAHLNDQISGQIPVSTLKKNTVVFTEIGHSTGALGHAFTAGSAILACCCIYLAIFADKGVVLNISNGGVVGLCLGAFAPFVFIGFLIRGLLKTVKRGVEEIRRQYEEIPFLAQGKAHADVKKISDLLARLSMDSLIFPSLVMVIIPVFISFFGNNWMLAGYMLGNTCVALGLGFVFANTGTPLRHVLQLIEADYFGGKSTPNYPSAIQACQLGNVLGDVVSLGLTVYSRCVVMIVLYIVSILHL